MPESRVLFLSLSRQSTGEVRFFTSALKGSTLPAGIAHLCMDAALAPMFGDFPGTLLPVAWSRKLEPDHVLAFVRKECGGYRKIVLLDLNSAILEYSWTLPRTEAFLEALSRETKADLAVYDVMGVFGKNGERMLARRRDAEVEVDAFIAENLAVPGRISVKKSFYMSRYLKPRTLNQLVAVPGRIAILRSVPYAWPNSEDGEAIIYFRCRFEELAEPEPVPGKVLLGFSKMAENLLPAESLKEFFTWLALRLREEMGVRELVVIDPCLALDPADAPPGMACEIHPRMARDLFLGHLARSEFIGCFIPTASVGVTAIQNRVPFVSFRASEESSRYMRHRSEPNAIPRFTSLGIWEDFAYIRELSGGGNPYFRCTRSVDVSRAGEFGRCAADLRGGRAHRDIDEYLRRGAEEIPGFEEVIAA